MKNRLFIASIVVPLILAFWGLWPSGTKIKILFDGKPAANKELELLLGEGKITLDENGEYRFHDNKSKTIIVKGNTVIQNKPSHTVIFDISDKRWTTTTIKYHFKLGAFEIKETKVIEAY